MQLDLLQMFAYNSSVELETHNQFRVEDGLTACHTYGIMETYWQAGKMAKQLPLSPTTKTTFRVSADLYRRLKIQAVQENRPVAELIIDGIELYLSRKAKGGS